MTQKPAFRVLRMTRRLNIAITILFVFAVLMSSIAMVHVFTPKTGGGSTPPPQGPTGEKIPPTLPEVIASAFTENSVALSVAGWICIAGLLVWRGGTRSIWNKLGFDQDVFRLFVKMRGASTRLRLLQGLSNPKDRAQLSEDLGIDWKAVDRHVRILEKYGFVEEKSTEGTAKFYQLTPSGDILLKLIEEKEEVKQSN
jgi:predicted transcriptional regulator